MLKSLMIGFVAISLLMVACLVYYAVAKDGGPGAWLLVAIWTVAVVLIPFVALRARLR